MNVFTALLGEIKGVFGKEYFLAGLLPAGTFVFAWHWFYDRGSASSIVADIEGLVTSGDKIGELGAAALAALALALLLFAARSWTTQFFETLPGRPLRTLRAYLLRRQWSAYANAQLAEQVQLHLYLVVNKWTGDEDFGTGQYLPPFETPAAPAETSRLCASATTTFLDVMARGPWYWALFQTSPLNPQSPVQAPTRTEAEVIISALRTLFAAVQTDGVAPWLVQIDLWRTLVRSPRGSVVIQVIRDHVHRGWVDSRQAMDRFPLESKWIGPTRLGTKAAALDDYAERRYGVDTSMLLSRLSGVLEDADKNGLSDARLSVEVLINLSVAMAAIAVVVFLDSLRLIAVSIAGLDFSAIGLDLRTTLFFVLPLLFAVVFHRGAFHAYSHLAERVRRIVDLNRLKLLKELGLPIPEDMDHERRLWIQLNEFFWNGTPLRPPPPLKLGE